MTRYRDDRYDNRSVRDRRPDDRRQDDERGLFERVGDFFQGRDDDRSRDDRYGDRSGMGQGYGDRSMRDDRDRYMDRPGMESSRDQDRMGRGYEQDRDIGMGYGSSSYQSSSQRYGQRQMSGLGGQSGSGQYGGGQYDRSREMSSDQYRDDRQYQGGMYGSNQYSYTPGAAGAGMSQGGMDMSGTTSHRGKGPKGYQRSDDRVREQANDALEDEHGVDASDIEVQVQNGEVTLTGTVSDRQQKRRAEECVEHLRGVRDVHNQLRVQQGTRSGMTGMSSQSETSTLTRTSGQQDSQD